MSLNVVSTLELDGLEKSFCLHGGWTIIGHAAHLTGDHSKLVANASQVIQYLLKRYSRLRTRIRVDGNRYFLDIFEYNSEYLSSDLFFSIVETTDESWQQIVENRCNQNPYSNNGTIIFPLFHFMIVFDRQCSQSFDDRLFHLLLFTNHSVSDGRSGFILINDFLTLATSTNLLNVSQSINTEILPLICEMIPRPYGPLYPLLAFVAKHVFKQELRKLIQPRIPVQGIPLVNCEPTTFPIKRYKNKFLFSSSSSNLYPSLHKQCRSHEVTLGGALLGCFLLAIHHCFPLDNNNRLVPFNIGMPFDMRTRLTQSPLTNLSVGFCVGMGETKLNRSLSLSSTRFWSLAHQCMIMTRNQLKKHGVPLMMHTFSDVIRNEHDFNRYAQLFPEGRESEIAFSNVGKYPFSCDYDQGQLRLRGMHVINNSSVYRVSTVMFITCVGNEQLDISLEHDMESDEKAQEFLNYYIQGGPKVSSPK